MTDTTITITNKAPVYFGREIVWDVYGSCVIFATRRDAQDFPCITIDLYDKIETFEVFKWCAETGDVIPASSEDVAENEPRHTGRNSKLIFIRTTA